MNAFAHGFSPASRLARDMARDLFGHAAPARPAVDYHTTLSALDTRGAFSVVDSTSPAGTAMPGHVHAEEDEIVIVLSGEVEIRLGERLIRRAAGTSAFIPRGTEHAVRALSQARTIAILTRQSLESPAA